MATKKAKQKKPVKAVQVGFGFDLPKMKLRVDEMGDLFEQVLVKHALTEDDWFAAMISLSVEAARLAKVLGYDEKAFIRAFTVTAEDIFDRSAEAAPQKPAKKPAPKKAAPKKPAKKPARKGGKK